MPLVETSPDDTTLSPAVRAVQLRLHGGIRDDEVVAIPHGKHSVGAGPRCAVRLTDAGVRPLHCLIVHDAEGLRVRRWSDETLLNGAPFDESPLAAGDLLTVGPIELEVVRPELDGHGWHVIERHEVDSSEEPAAECVEIELANEAIEEVVVPTVDEIDELDDIVETAPKLIFDEVETPTPPAETMPVKRRRKRKLLAAWRRSREEYVALIRRIDELEQRVESLVAGLHSPSGETLATILDANLDAEISLWPASEEATPADWAQEKLQLIHEQCDLAESNSTLADELAATRAELATTQVELAKSRSAIASLEDQLEESQATCRQFIDEREHWQFQLTNLEALMGGHLTRIDELERDLHELKLRKSEPIDATSDPVAVRENLLLGPTVGEGYDDFIAGELANELADEESVGTDETYPMASVWGAPASVEATQDEFDWGSHEPVQSSGFGGGNDSEDPYAWESELQEEISQSSVALDVEPLTEVDEEESEPEVRCDRVSDDVSELMAQLQTMPLWGQEERLDDALTDSISSAATSLADLLDEPAETSVEEKSTVTYSAEVDSSEVDSVEDVSANYDTLESDSVESTRVEITEEFEPEQQFESVATNAREIEEAESELDDVLSDRNHAPEPVSYIERYSHLFDGESTTESERPTPALPLARTAEVRSTPAPASDDEDSIEQYMARMMQRLRGESESRSSAPSNNDNSDLEDGNMAGRNDAGGAVVEATPIIEAPAQEPFVSLEQLRSKVAVPERFTDIGAMRALANQSARQAISIHRVRTLRRNAMTKFILSMLAAASSLFFILDSPGWQSLQFVTACIACVAAIRWGWLTFTSLIEAVQAGAFDKEVEDGGFRAVELANHSLPIDVAR